MNMRFLSSKQVKWLLARVGPLLPALLALLLLSGVLHMPRPVAVLGQGVVAPLFDVRDNVLAALVTLYGSLETKDMLLYENEQLHRELTTLRRESFMVDVLERENVRLQALLGHADGMEGSIPATVIHGAGYAPFGSFIVNVGAAAGVREGMLVRVPEGVAVGAVVAVQETRAVVTLFSAAGMRTDAYLAREYTVPVVVLGEGGETMRVQLSRVIEVSIGDLLLLPGIPGVPMGRVVRVDATEEDAYRSVYVAPAVSSMSLRDVLIDTTHLWQLSKDSISAPIVPAVATRSTSSTQTTSTSSSTEYAVD